MPGGEAAAASAGEDGVTKEHFLGWVDYLAILGVGGGAGVTGWMATAHQAARFLFARAPSSWKLWRRKVLTSP